MLLRVRKPFDFRRTLKFILGPPPLLNGRQFAPLLDYFETNEYRRVAEVRGQPVLYGVSERRRGKDSRLAVRVLAGPSDPATLEAISALVERQFATGLDLTSFYEISATDPVLSRLAARFRGMRIAQSPSVYETLISAILEQQVNLAFAHQVKKALIEAFGDRIEFDGRRYSAFPEPAALAIVTRRELRKIQISGPKAGYIIQISRDVLDGSLNLEGLRTLEPQMARGRLLERKGVGPWTAQYVGLRALGHLDCLPAADVGLQKAVRAFYGLRRQPTAKRVERLARNWSGWRSYATFYLWLTYWESAAWREQFIKELRGRRNEEKRS